MSENNRKRLGEILLAAGKLTEPQLQDALEEQKRTRERLGQILIRLGYVTPEELSGVLGIQLNLPVTTLEKYLIDPQMVHLIPENLARQYMVIPLFKVGGVVTLGMVDPLNVFAVDDIKKRLNCQVQPVLISENDMQKAHEQYYSLGDSMDTILTGVQDDAVEIIREEGEELGAALSMVDEAPVIKLVNLIILKAIQLGASDIHVEPDVDRVRVRYRVDGILREMFSPPQKLQAAIISRIKIMSELDIAERRLPQDGRFQVKMEARKIDLRVSIVPTVFGEKAVMRVLDRKSFQSDLNHLGFEPRILSEIEKMLLYPYGIFLVTGPTGSGKTTTLYSALTRINSREKNITTIEDPVEYQLATINQIQVNEKVGLVFAKGLRSILRQDPDIIMVGEMRDVEAAQIAIQSALTGHLVFSTLHTNDAPGAIVRMADMGIEPYLVVATVIGVLAQRLVRKICPACKQSYEPPAELIKGLDYSFPPVTKFFRGQGCDECLRSGYKGRIGIYELMMITPKIKRLVLSRAPESAIRDAAVEEGLITLRKSGLAKVTSGITTLEEVMRVTYAEDKTVDLHSEMIREVNR